MKKHALVITLVLILGAAFTLPAFAQAPAGPKVIRWAYSMPAKRTMAYGWEWMGPEFEKATNGRYKVEFYPGETLYKEAAGYDSIASGVAHIGQVSVGGVEKRLPLSQVALLPTLDFPNSLKGIITGGRAFLDVYNKFPQLREEYKGVKVFGFHLLSSYILVSKKKEITLPEQLKGLKIGGSGAKMRLVSNYGGADVNQVPPDAFMNLDKGVVDACFVNWPQILVFKLWEAAKYFYNFGFGGGAHVMLMNPDFWNGMPPEDQKIFMEIWEKAYEMGVGYNFAEIEKGQKATAAGGASVRTPTKEETAAWRKAAEPVIDLWLKGAKANNLKDPDILLGEWKKRIETFKE